MIAKKLSLCGYRPIPLVSIRSFCAYLRAYWLLFQFSKASCCCDPTKRHGSQLRPLKKSADAVVSAELPILILHFANLIAPGVSTIAANTPLPAEFRPAISFENYGRGTSPDRRRMFGMVCCREPKRIAIASQISEYLSLYRKCCCHREGRNSLSMFLPDQPQFRSIARSEYFSAISLGVRLHRV